MRLGIKLEETMTICPMEAIFLKMEKIHRIAGNQASKSYLKVRYYINLFKHLINV